jgi:hypothetical protein
MKIISVKSLLEKCHDLTFLRDITFSRPLYPPKVTFWSFYNLAGRFTDNLTNNSLFRGLGGQRRGLGSNYRNKFGNVVGFL